MQSFTDLVATAVIGCVCSLCGCTVADDSADDSTPSASHPAGGAGNASRAGAPSGGTVSNDAGVSGLGGSLDDQAGDGGSSDTTGGASTTDGGSTTGGASTTGGGGMSGSGTIAGGGTTGGGGTSGSGMTAGGGKTGGSGASGGGGTSGSGTTAGGGKTGSGGASGGGGTSGSGTDPCVTCTEKKCAELVTACSTHQPSCGTVLQCVDDTKCAVGSANEGVNCYCGALDADACFNSFDAAVPQGPCKAAINAAAGTGVPLQVGQIFYDLSTGIGSAMQQVSCKVASCKAECHL